MPDERMMANDALRSVLLAIGEVMGADGMKAMLHGAKLDRYVGNYPAEHLELGVKFNKYCGTEQAE